jgi:flagellar assembly factor FliW
MKVLTASSLPEVEPASDHVIDLPQGLIGFAGYTRAELRELPDQPPFLWMTLHGPAGIVNFVVVEPGGVIPGYEPELFDADAAALDLAEPGDAQILAIVSLQPHAPLSATANLIGPLVINRRTRLGRQLVIANNSRYSARHPLLGNDTPAGGNA